MNRPAILCPVDFGSASLAAVELAVQEAKRRGAILDLLHVWEPGIQYTGEGLPLPLEADLPRAKIEAELAGLPVDLPSERVRLHVGYGPTAKNIVDLVGTLGCELVVMGTHARRGLRRWIIGSVCESVLHDCPCPVLVCRGPEKNQDS